MDCLLVEPSRHGFFRAHSRGLGEVLCKGVVAGAMGLRGRVDAQHSPVGAVGEKCGKALIKLLVKMLVAYPIR